MTAWLSGVRNRRDLKCKNTFILLFEFTIPKSNTTLYPFSVKRNKVYIFTSDKKLEGLCELHFFGPLFYKCMPVKYSKIHLFYKCRFNFIWDLYSIQPKGMSWFRWKAIQFSSHIILFKICLFMRHKIYSNTRGCSWKVNFFVQKIEWNQKRKKERSIFILFVNRHTKKFNIIFGRFVWINVIFSPQK